MKARLLILVKFLTLQNEDDTVFSFELGKASVIKPWEIAVKTMKI
jgi:hypothetical protein